MMSNCDRSTTKYADLGCCFSIVIVALCVGLLDLKQSGEQWLDDGPVYCNNGAMVHDWLVSGDWSDPFDFAKENYVKYPFHAVPYHPPGYALLLGTWFTVVGMSYAAARVFVALCLGLALCFFYGILRRQGLAWWMAIFPTLLLATTPEIGRWSRSAMSEIPGMLFILAGSYCFVRSVDTEKARWRWLAFILAEIAFFCRISTAGVLPAWFLFLFATHGFRRVLRLNMIAPATIYLAIGASWVKFVSSIASNEVRQSLRESLQGSMSADNLLKWLQGLPAMVGWIALAAAASGLILAFRDRKLKAFAWFWLFWFLSCYALQVAQSIHFESRYFIFSLPAICALAVVPVVVRFHSRTARTIAVLVLGVAIVGNTISIARMLQGLRGFDAVADQLASRDDPGNILLSSRCDSDLAFRFRCHSQKQDRQIIRGDRVLAIRVPSYAGVATTALAETHDDVLDIIRRGRIRYLVTSPPSQLAGFKRADDMVLLHETALAQPDLFDLIGQHKILVDVGVSRQVMAYVWRFKGELPEGKSELPVRIPTASMTIHR